MRKMSSVFLSVILILANVLIVNLLIVPIGINNVSAFPGGDGSGGNPFQIGNVTDLQNMSANLSAHYILINDIDASNTTNWNGGLGFSPIANDTNPSVFPFQGVKFTGSFDGQGYKIMNLTIDRSSEDYIGLFGYLDSIAVIKNVSLINITANGRHFVGSLSGNNNGTVTNCIANGNISGTNWVAGLIGNNIGAVMNCTVYGNVSGNDYVAGLIGYNDGALIKNCTAYSYILGEFVTGGLIGRNYGGTVTDCTAYGNVTGNTMWNNYFGALMGNNAGGGTVMNCTAYGNATGTAYIGGLIGENSVGGTVTNCTAFGNASGEQRIGGLIGTNLGGTVTDCNAYGDTNGTATEVGGLFGLNTGSVTDSNAFGNTTGTDIYVGGLIGLNSGPVTDCTANGNTTGPDKVGGLIGENTGLVSNCVANGNVTGNSRVGGLVGQNEGGTLFNCTAYCDVNATSVTSAYAGGLVGFNNAAITDCIAYGNTKGTGGYICGLVGWYMVDTVITNSFYDINGSLINGENIITPFGIYDYQFSDWLGNNKFLNVNDYLTFQNGYYEINNMTDLKDFLGLSTINQKFILTNDIDLSAEPEFYIPYMSVDEFYGNNTTISNLQVYRDNDYIGFFGFVKKGKISNLYLENMNVSGYWNVGGLIGYNKGTVTNCTSHGNVSETEAVGGLIGYNKNKPVTNCTAHVNVTGTGYGGGLIGFNNGGAVTDCTTYVNITGTGSLYDGFGGLIGYNYDAPVTSCTVYGNISGTGGGDAIGGLIGYNYGGTVTSCTINCNATATHVNSFYIGGLIGENDGGTVTSCTAYGNATGTSWVGGLIAGNYGGMVTNCTAFGIATGTGGIGGLIAGNDGGTVTGCIAYGNTSGTSFSIGGLIGNNINQGTVTNSTAYGNVSGYYNVGGLIGNIDRGTVTNSTAYGNVTGDFFNIGGLVGQHRGGTVTDCTAYGNTIGTDYNIGGLIGRNWQFNLQGGTVTNCTAHGNANGTDEIGGLIGLNQDSTITNCTAYGNANGTGANIGGLIGWNNGGIVIDCTAYGNANGTAEVAGLIGYNVDGAVTNCTAYGNATSVNDDAGGLIGYNNGGTITGCIAYGNAISTGVVGIEYVGGLIGDHRNANVADCIAYGDASANGDLIGGLFGNCQSATVINCKAFGNVTGTGDYIGGLIGWNDGTIENCTAHGTVNGTGIDSEYIGGLIGENDGGTVENCTAYGNATGDEWIGGLIGWNEVGGQITNCTAYGNAAGDDWIGGLIGGNGGTVTSCIAYGNATDTGANSYNVGGLIGYNAGTVTGCTAYGNATGTDEVGGLIGWNEVGGQITNCTAYGNAAGGDWIGGLVGINKGTVTNCTAFGDVTSIGDFIGGLIGHNEGGTVENCYSHGDATGDDSIGGLIGNNTGIVRYCYSIGFVSGNANVSGLIGVDTGTVTACFWDNITSGQTSSAAGTGKNTTVMQQESTFTGAGWNFTGIWAINNGKTYPYFGRWYNPPQITTADVDTATEDALYSVDYDAALSSYPPDNYIDYWTVTTNGSGWLSIDSNGVLSGTPSNDDLGTYWVNVTVTDIYGGTHSANFSLTILNVNTPPYITTLNDPIAVEDIPYSVDYDATDPDPTADILSWNYTTDATWLNFNKLTSVLFGTPGNINVGTYYVNITVHDDKGGNNSTNFTLTVLNVNDDPVISTLDNPTAYEDTQYSVDYEAGDIDPTNDILNWTLVTNTTANWLSIDPETGVLSGTPSNADIGVIQVNVTVTDGKGGLDFRNFSLTINNVNDDPVITTADQPTATEDVLYSVDYEVTDDDLDNVHKWTLSTDATWLDIDDSTGVLSGTPTNNDVGTYWVNVTVDDWNGGIDRHNFTLTVLNVNDPPYITTTDVTTATEDELYSVAYNATDIDPTSDILSWSVKTDAGWLSIASISGILSGTPTNDDITTFWANVSVHDGNDGSASQNFTITVNNVNDHPTITTADVTTATAGEMYTVDYNATDIDPTNDILTWSLETNADWLSLETGTGILSGAPIEDDVGDYLVNITVGDGNGGSDTSSFTLTVEPGVVITNLDPEIITADVTTANVDILYSVTYQATDDRTAAANLTWTMATDANWLNFAPSTRLLSGTPTASDVGDFWVLITVNDGEGGTDSTNFTITVTGPTVNTQPVLTNGAMSPASGDTDTEFTFSVHYQDADGDAPDTIKVVIDGTEQDLTLKSGDAADGTYTYTAKLSKGAHTYYFTANDGTDDATSTDGTPTSVANTETTSEIEEPEEKAAFEDWMLYLIIIIIIVIIIALLAFAMSRRKGAPLTEESFFATEEEELDAEDELVAEEEMIDDDETGEDSEEKSDEDTFECPTCGAELKADDTVCAECGEEFEED